MCIYILSKKKSEQYIYMCIEHMVASIYVPTNVASGLTNHWKKELKFNPGSNLVNIRIPEGDIEERGEGGWRFVQD